MADNVILIIDDDRGLRVSLSAFLEKKGYSTLTAATAQEGLEIIENNTVDLVLLDIRMPGMDGITALKKIKEINSDLNVIIITGYGSIETAVEAMKEGAVDYVTKPFNLKELSSKIETSLKIKYMVIKNKLDEREEEGRESFSNLIGKSKQMQEVYELIAKIARKDVTVLILGESGVGKEMVAKAIHQNSQRKDGPFIKVNCAALPDQLLESELFGYEKGAFTGASRQKKGMFELADGGTIFLDEIGDMSLATQAKILRVLQEHEFQRLGGEETIRVNVRVLAATNIDIQQAIERGKFREDLYYRLNVVRINMPPLRERPEDIPLLTNEFIKEYNQKHNKEINGVAPDAMRLLMSYDWPGNVRELKNICEQAVVLNDSNVITAADLPVEIRGKGFNLDANQSNQSLKDITKNLTSEIERKIITETLEETGWNRNETAQKLGITPRTLYNKIKEYKIER
ncbi:MAG: two-component system, NtrC family, response regulator AtoC [Halanaerobiales bacterium]|nr:two-component system, NtrC family, response regulator AtoC [Halanaerobiales bacterium]